MVQSLALVLLACIPLFGLFRIDLASARFMLLGYAVDWDNYLFLLGLTLVVISVPLLTYVTVGSLWCGWACPQNFLSEWANGLTLRWLGKRADVRVDGDGMVVASAKNRLSHWLALGIPLLAMSFMLGLLVLMGFYPAKDIWDFVTGATVRQANMAIMLGFTVLLVFIDIAVARYFFCDYACFYRMGQRLFQTREVLHIAYDASRVQDCAKCHYCATVCPTRIQPNHITAHDICIDCGECIDACHRLHDKAGTLGLLKFSRGEVHQHEEQAKSRSHLNRFRGLVGLLFLSGCSFMAWGLWTQPRVDLQQQAADQQRLLAVVHHCQPRCAPLQAQCRGDNLARCYEAAACSCSCSLEQDPGNPQRAIWESCVRLNQQHLQTFLQSRHPVVNP